MIDGFDAISQNRFAALDQLNLIRALCRSKLRTSNMGAAMARRHGAGLSSKSVSVALTDAERTAWKRSADALGVSVSDLVRQSVNYYLKARTEALRSRQEPAKKAARPSAPNAVNPRALDAAAPPLKDNHLTAVTWRFK